MCRQAAYLALMSYPGGLQLGGGVTAENAEQYLEAGASHVIVTSYVFRDGRLDEERLQNLVTPHIVCCIFAILSLDVLSLFLSMPLEKLAKLVYETSVPYHLVKLNTAWKVSNIVDNETQAMHRRKFWDFQRLDECIFKVQIQGYHAAIWQVLESLTKHVF